MVPGQRHDVHCPCQHHHDHGVHCRHHDHGAAYEFHHSSQLLSSTLFLFIIIINIHLQGGRSIAKVERFQTGGEQMQKKGHSLMFMMLVMVMVVLMVMMLLC